MAAKYGLLLNFHGGFKPAGLTRTYPNVVNFEGVYGLEQMKFPRNNNVDMVTYDVTVPYIRMMAGPMDYTQGAMHNATKKNFRAACDYRHEVKDLPADRKIQVNMAPGGGYVARISKK